MNSVIQQTIYNALVGNSVLMALIKGVYDHVPQPADAGSIAAFPYITIGSDSVRPWDTSTSLGAEARVTINVWSRVRGRKETKAILDQVRTVLHYKNLAVSGGGGFVYCLLEYSETFQDPDGLTTHGVARYVLVIDNV